MSHQRITKTPPELLLYADSESDADMLYFGGVFVPDPFIAFTCRGARVAVVSQLEFARVRKEGRFDEVLSLEELSQRARRAEGDAFHHPESVIALLARECRIRRFRVPATFPCGPAFRLRAKRISIEVAEGALFPARERKTDAEAALIRAGNAAAAAGFRAVEKLLRQAQVRNGYLVHSGRRLTSERVQEVVAIACLGHGAIAANTIVAGGDQACDPHCRGSGPLRAHQFIIVDIFPRVSKTGYFGDMTRTYLKGRPSDAQKALYHAVFETQQAAIPAHRAGRSAAAIYRSVRRAFDQRGYPTRRDNGVPVGFIHGLGHGLGLAVHEPPRVNPSGPRLRSGQVLTVEPGLYYPGLGGVRVEDVIRVTPAAPEPLSAHPYRWAW